MLDVSVQTKLTSNIHHLISNFMSEPEIARRCPACSAMVRMSATFCPHCGTPLQRRAAAQTPPAERNSEITERPSAINNEELPAVSVVAQQEDAAAKRILPPPAPTDLPAQSPAADSFATKRLDDYEVSDNRSNRNVERRENSTTGNRRRVIATKAVAARGQIEENLRPRVAKLKQTSSTVLDEAAIDPGLRFVLVAAVFFLLTVALLMFSKLLH